MVETPAIGRNYLSSGADEAGIDAALDRVRKKSHFVYRFQERFGNFYQRID